MGLFESAEQLWLEDSKSLAFYFPDMSLVESISINTKVITVKKNKPKNIIKLQIFSEIIDIEYKDKNAVKGPLAYARGPYGMELFSPQEVEKLREKLSNLGSVGKVLDKRQAFSMRVKVFKHTSKLHKKEH